MSADAEAAGLTTASVETATLDTIPSIESSDDSLFIHSDGEDSAPPNFFDPNERYDSPSDTDTSEASS